MKKLIGYIIVGLCVFVCMSNLKVEAAELPLAESNYCEYVFTGWGNATLLIIPYRKVGDNWQGNADGTTKLTYSVSGIKAIDGNAGNAKSFKALAKIIEEDGKTTIKCPMLCSGTGLACRTPDSKVENSVTFYGRQDGEGCNFPTCTNDETPKTHSPNGSSNSNPGKEEDNKNKVDSTCKGIIGKEQEDFIRTIMGYIQILAPLLLIVMCASDMVRAVMASDEKKMKEAYVKSAKRIIAAICVFLIPIFVKILLNLPGIKGALQKSGVVDSPLCYGATNSGNSNPNPNPNPSISYKTISGAAAGTIKVPTTWTTTNEKSNRVSAKDSSGTFSIDVQWYKAGNSNLEIAAENVRRTYSDWPETSVNSVTIDGIAGYYVSAKRGNEMRLVYILTENIQIFVETDGTDSANLKELVKGYKLP